MRVLVYDGGIYTEKEIDNSLKALQREVGGYIEIPCLFDDLMARKIDIIVNEEGKLTMSEKPSIIIKSKMDEEILDIIYGPCLFASSDDEGNTVGLTDGQIKYIKEFLGVDGFIFHVINEHCSGFRIIKEVKI